MSDPSAELMFPERRDARLLLSGIVMLWVGVVGSFVFIYFSGQPSHRHSPMPPEIALLWFVAAIGGATAALNYLRAVKRLRAGAEPFPARGSGTERKVPARILGAAASRLGFEPSTAVALYVVAQAIGFVVMFLVFFGSPFPG